jgi:Holliday junction resolvasome RuvABC endonuclease subunit
MTGCAGGLTITRPDIVAVEQVAGFHNRKVIQVLSRFEGVALLAAKQLWQEARRCCSLEPHGWQRP